MKTAAPAEPKTANCDHCGAAFTPEVPGDEMCSWSCVAEAAYNATGDDE